MALPRYAPESAADRCFGCAGAIRSDDLAVYLDGAWFHVHCYHQERAHRNERKDFSLARRRVMKDPLAVELGRRGGLKGGKARAEKLTPGRRTTIARRAALARWEGRRSLP
ncbi:MAG TPA: hypothetical protein VFL90_13060 [Methylomirabilota bacterium]|nr:hypothetical protein [Methylomirabilota bacterium]